MEQLAATPAGYPTTSPFAIAWRNLRRDSFALLGLLVVGLAVFSAILWQALVGGQIDLHYVGPFALPEGGQRARRGRHLASMGRDHRHPDPRAGGAHRRISPPAAVAGPVRHAARHQPGEDRRPLATQGEHSRRRRRGSPPRRHGTRVDRRALVAALPPSALTLRRPADERLDCPGAAAGQHDRAGRRHRVRRRWRLAAKKRNVRRL